MSIADLIPPMIAIPSGPFLMGTPERDLSALAQAYGGTRESYREEAPQHALALAAFAIGRMPVTKRLPYQWYDTPNIRVGTFKDFEVLAEKNGLRIEDAFGLQEGQEVRFMPNALAGTAVFRFSK